MITYKSNVACSGWHDWSLDKTQWADKSLGSDRHAEVIFTAYPEAKMIHVIRDPRDRYASRLYHPTRGSSHVSSSAALWLWSGKLALGNLENYPGRYRILRYESLVENPEFCLRELCDFLDVMYSQEMLMIKNQVGDTSESVPRDAELLPRNIWKSSVGQYRKTLSKRGIAFLQLIAGEKMAEFDYPLEQLSLTWSSRFLFFLFDCPVKLTSMLFWHAKERLHTVTYGYRKNPCSPAPESGSADCQYSSMKEFINI